MTCAILFYSGAAFERDKQQAFAAGAQGYLVKPAGPDELTAEVIRIVSAARRTKAAGGSLEGALKERAKSIARCHYDSWSGPRG